MCQCFFAAILVVFNIVFLVLGLAFIGGGGLILYGTDLISDLIKPIFSKLPSDVSIDMNDFLNEIIDMIKSVPIALIIIGVVIVCLAILSFVVGCCKVKIAGYIYIALVGLIIVIQIAFILIVYTNTKLLEAPVIDKLQKMIKEEYAGANGTNTESMIMNVLHITMKCCGAKDGGDFNSSTKWPRSFSLAASTDKIPKEFLKYYNGTTEITLKYPMTCCKMSTMGKFDNIMGCIVNGTDVNTEGCVPKLFDMFVEMLNKQIPVLIISLVILFQVFLLVAALVVILCEKAKVDVV